MNKKTINDVVDSLIEISCKNAHKKSYLKELLKKLLVDKIDFVSIISDDIKKTNHSHRLEDFVNYSYDVLVIPAEMNKGEREYQILKKALLLYNLKASKTNHAITVKSGFEIVKFIFGQNKNTICKMDDSICLNSIAAGLYAKYIIAASKDGNLCITDFINSELQREYRFETKAYLLLSDKIGSQIFFDAFINSDIPKLDNELKRVGISFEQLARKFENGIDLEYVRNLIRIADVNLSYMTALNGQAFEEIILGLEDWITEGLGEADKQEIMKIAKQYFVESYFYSLFGTQIDIQKEIENIKWFYSQFVKKEANKLNLFKKLMWNKKYKQLKKESFEIAKSVLETEQTSRDIVEDARSLMVKTERLNKQLEREDTSIHDGVFSDIKEIFMNCMFATTNDAIVLGREIGQLFSLKSAAKRVEDALHKKIRA